MMRGKSLLLGLASVAALGLGIWLGQVLTRPPLDPPKITGTFIPEPKDMPDFTLVDQDGQRFHRDRFKGHWTFLYFGYTYCPDVCPLTLLELNKMKQQLTAKGQDTDSAYMLISVDPQRDTPQRLGEYARYFNPQFQGATGTLEELTKLAQHMGIIFMRSPNQENEANYTIDHSSTVILIDPDARMRAVFMPPHKPDVMAADFIKIRDYLGAVN